MGTLRSCYTTRVNFFRDDPTRWTEISYYFVPWTKTVVPFSTIFTPIVWNWNQGYPLPGEDLVDHNYYNGEDAWGCPGKAFIGSAEQWELGALTTDPVPAYDEELLCPVECGCDPAPPIFTCGFCPGGASSKYRVTIAGATGPAAVYNGTWLVPYVNACFWFNPSAGDDGLEFRFLQFGPNLVKRVDTDNQRFFYILTNVSNCFGTWTLGKAGGGTYFAFMPATILVESI